MKDDIFKIEESIKEFSVTEISNKIKEIIEGNFNYIKVRGEISGLKIASSGHCYFSIKDNQSLLNCICWKYILPKIKFQLNDGLEVSITGKITTYQGRSYYQLIADNIEPAGIGTILKILQERKEKFEKEGLFDQSRKKRLPFMPTKIGIVTSLTGAVLHDIIHRISDRCPTHIIIAPVTVQGESASKEIASAIDLFNELEPKDRPDLLIVARGGGSIEDLWAFNEEIVVRSVANSNIPIISAVGHETDYTLIDLAADLRAPTPTAAAELATIVISELKGTLNSYSSKLFSNIKQLLKYNQQHILNYQRILKYPVNYINLRQQKLDELSFKLEESLPHLLHFKQTKLKLTNINQSRLINLINYKNLQLDHQFSYLLNSISNNLLNFNNKISNISSLLSSLDYNKTLKRGFTIIKNQEGKILSSKASIEHIKEFKVKFYDGEIGVQKI